MIQAGDQVKKGSGDYTYEGEVVSAFRKRSGAQRYVVEDARGLLLIMSDKQLTGQERNFEYELLMARAPAQDSPEFVDFLRANNTVVHESRNWIVVENFKRHRADQPWLTAFYKGKWGTPFAEMEELFQARPEWFDWEWRKHDVPTQSITKRFHLHLIKP